MDVYSKIKEDCLASKKNNPLELLVELMHKDYIQIHGPEHHVLDGACFLTALHNQGIKFDLNAALDEMITRGSKMPGAICGQWGVCGSTASLGAALAIWHGTGPLSENEYYKDNMRYTSKAIEAMSEIGGPRCCKRNAYLSTKTMIQFMKEQYGIELKDADITCEFSEYNQQCIGDRCPFHNNTKKTE